MPTQTIEIHPYTHSPHNPHSTKQRGILKLASKAYILREKRVSERIPTKWKKILAWLDYTCMLMMRLHLLQLRMVSLAGMSRFFGCSAKSLGVLSVVNAWLVEYRQQQQHTLTHTHTHVQRNILFVFEHGASIEGLRLYLHRIECFTNRQAI